MADNSMAISVFIALDYPSGKATVESEFNSKSISRNSGLQR